MGDLAPRDVVAAAIEARLRETGDECVFLDARSIERFAQRFPTVTAACRDAGIDPTTSPIPVVPGAHYSCGGVSTDVYGRTTLPGLFAAGEVARTGMHGANRLASNSLLEGLVVGGRAGREAAGHAHSAGAPMAKVQLAQRVALDRGRVQQAMTRWASVVRDADGLNLLIDTLDDAAPRTMVNRTDMEDVALTLSARVVAAAALARTETRGCHHRGDFPDTDQAQAIPVSVHGTADGGVALVEPAVPVAR
jgi:L-aspartate oxidase